jgi:hypothetical protein
LGGGRSSACAARQAAITSGGTVGTLAFSCAEAEELRPRTGATFTCAEPLRTGI